MTTSLIPERPLLISPTLAATIGLEEAVMLHVLSELLLQHPPLYREERRWAELDGAALARAMPFWQPEDIKRVQRNLQEKGLIRVQAGDAGGCLYAINQKCEEAAAAAPAPQPKAARAAALFDSGSGGRAGHIPPDWQPSEDLYRQCAVHNIPRDFVAQQVRSFVMYQRERGRAQYSWNTAFLNWILRQWRGEESRRGARELESDMSPDWRPSEEATTILEHGGIPHDFIEDAVPEFVLYWRERGIVTSTWNTKFLQHVRRQWASYNAALENDPTPRPIPPDWAPSEACLDVLSMARIDLDFARAQVKEFLLYWQDRKEVCASWNTRFLQHVKNRWAAQSRQRLPADRQLESAIERFTDRSWAK